MAKHRINPDDCIACTTCVAHCPVTAATRKFRGPKMLGPALERFRISEEDYEPSLEYCSNCKNCDLSCPSGVPVSTLNMLAKAAYYKKNPQSMRDHMLSHGENMAKMVNAIPFGAALANVGMHNPVSRAAMKQIGISDKAPMPTYAATSFVSWFKSQKQTPSEEKVVFFPGCFINYNQPQVGKDLVAVLQHNGIEVIVPEEFVCCGSPLVTGGYLDEAESNARKNAAEIAKWAAKGYKILTACTSCGLMLNQEYQELFPAIEGLAQNALSLYDAFEFLAERAAEGKLKTDFAPVQEHFMYHVPCHLRVQGIGLPALTLLRQIPGLSIEEADAGCCGISGNYGFRDEKFEISMAVGAELFQRIKDSGVKTVVCDCGTCRLQIGHGSGAATAHPVSILRKAYQL